MKAKFSAVHLTDPRQTAKEMARICTQYAGDLGELAKMPLPRFFDLVRKLPYMPDPQNAETLSRPRYLLEKDYAFRDCDDKAILIGAWCYLNGHPFGFYASSTKPSRQLHHVWTVAKINEKTVILDPTYRHHKLGELPRRECITRIEKLIEVAPMQLHTYEGLGDNLGFSLSKSLKKAGRAVKKTNAAMQRQVVATVKAPIRAAVQLKKGNVLKAVKSMAKPVPFATQAVNKAAAAGTQIKKGNVLKAGKLVASAAAAPVNAAAAVVTRAMPTSMKNAVKSAVRKVAGDKVTLATKAAILPAATAAAMAVPGVQPFALAVPAVVNMALDEIATTATKKAATVVKKTVSTATAAKKAAGVAVQPKKALLAQTAKARAAELKAKMEIAKATTGTAVAEAAQAAQAVQEEAQAAAPAAMNRKILIGGAAAAGLIGVYMINRKKRG
jgi:hypothetical protein